MIGINFLARSIFVFERKKGEKKAKKAKKIKREKNLLST
jgi:hypothetical protein